jgi:hypothetical protein
MTLFFSVSSLQILASLVSSGVADQLNFEIWKLSLARYMQVDMWTLLSINAWRLGTMEMILGGAKKVQVTHTYERPQVYDCILCTTTNPVGVSGLGIN